VIRADLQALVAGRRQLRRLVEQPGSDRAAIRAGATQVKNIRGTLRDQRLATQLAVRSMLTPGQWTR
jgi:Spy/CpxP family protein refolding chaperone